MTKDNRSFSLFEFVHRIDLVHKGVDTKLSAKCIQNLLTTRRAVTEKGGLHRTLYEMHFFVRSEFRLA